MADRADAVTVYPQHPPIGPLPQYRRVTDRPKPINIIDKPGSKQVAILAV